MRLSGQWKMFHTGFSALAPGDFRELFVHCLIGFGTTFACTDIVVDLGIFRMSGHAVIALTKIFNHKLPVRMGWIDLPMDNLSLR